MATEQRLIDAKAFDLRLSKKSMMEVFPNWKELPKETKDMICKHGNYLHMLLETQSTVDAVPVVRCKDCIYWDGMGYEGRCEPHKNGLIREYTNYDDFCSYGERR